jgi:hypothetical protein
MTEPSESRLRLLWAAWAGTALAVGIAVALWPSPTPGIHAPRPPVGAGEQSHPPGVGAMQANLGTPAEMAGRAAPEVWRGLTELRRTAREMREARLPAAQVAAVEARIVELEETLAARVKGVASGRLAPAGWATIDLDVNADGVVDGQDLSSAGTGGR